MCPFNASKSGHVPLQCQQVRTSQVSATRSMSKEICLLPKALQAQSNLPNAHDFLWSLQSRELVLDLTSWHASEQFPKYVACQEVAGQEIWNVTCASKTFLNFAFLVSDMLLRLFGEEEVEEENLPLLVGPCLLPLWLESLVSESTLLPCAAFKPCSPAYSAVALRCYGVVTHSLPTTQLKNLSIETFEKGGKPINCDFFQSVSHLEGRISWHYSWWIVWDADD